MSTTPNEGATQRQMTAIEMIDEIASDFKLMEDKIPLEVRIGLCTRLGYAKRQLERELAAAKAAIKKLREALDELLFVHENADETGYVDGVGFVKGFEQLGDKARAALEETEENEP